LKMRKLDIATLEKAREVGAATGAGWGEKAA